MFSLLLVLRRFSVSIEEFFGLLKLFAYNLYFYFDSYQTLEGDISNGTTRVNSTMATRVSNSQLGTNYNSSLVSSSFSSNSGPVAHPVPTDLLMASAAPNSSGIVTGLVSAAAIQQGVVPLHQKRDPNWMDVGIIKGTTTVVTHYLLPQAGLGSGGHNSHSPHVDVRVLRCFYFKDTVDRLIFAEC